MSILSAYVYALIGCYCRDENIILLYSGNACIYETECIDCDNVKKSCTYKNGLLHSFNDCPSMKKIGNGMNFDFGLSSLITLQWHRDGKLHRDDDKAAEIEQFAMVTMWRWYRDGSPYREGNKPVTEMTNNSFTPSCPQVNMSKLC